MSKHYLPENIREAITVINSLPLFLMEGSEYTIPRIDEFVFFGTITNTSIFFPGKVTYFKDGVIEVFDLYFQETYRFSKYSRKNKYRSTKQKNDRYYYLYSFPKAFSIVSENIDKIKATLQ